MTVSWDISPHNILPESLFNTNMFQRPSYFILNPYTLYPINYSVGQCYAPFFLWNLTICCQKKILNLPVALVLFHTEYHVIIFLQDFIVYHFSASLRWYQICWITGLGYCVIYFALIEVLVRRHVLPSCIETPWIFFSFGLSLWSVNPPLTLLLISMTCSEVCFQSQKYVFAFSLTVQKNLIFNFNQYYFTYCRDSNLCDLQQPKYCSVQFCSCVWVVSLWLKLNSWDLNRIVATFSKTLILEMFFAHYLQHNVAYFFT